MPVEKAEMQGSPKESWTLTGFSATRQFICAYGDRAALEAELLGAAYTPVADTGSICTGVNAVPFEAEQQGVDDDANYEKALVTAKWGTSGDTPEFVVDTYYTESLEPTAEFLTLDHKLYRWEANDGDPLTEDEAPGRLMRGMDYVRTKYNQATIPAAALSLVGTVNSAAVSPKTTGMSGLTFPAQTLLYQPPTIQRVVTAAGALAWNITYRFTYKPNWDGATARGWNWFWRAESQAYKQIYIAGGAVYNNYPVGNFALL